MRPSYDLAVVLTLHLDLLKLFLKLYLLLLLRRKARSLLLTTIGRLWSDEYLWLSRLTHQAAVLTLLKLIRVAILPREETALGLAFASILNRPVFGSWAFTLRKMYNAFESIRVRYILLILILLLLVD